MLEIKNLQAGVEGKAILKGLICRLTPAKCTHHGPKR